MTGVGVLGPWPGTDQHEAQATAIGELSSVPEGVTGLPPLVQLPGRGPWSHSLARTAALLTEMPVEVGPHGWKLADRPGHDVERVRAAMREELDVLAVTGFEYAGPLVLSLPGPWSMAATLYLARGDRVLSDPGAVRDLVAALGDGIGALLTSVASAVPGAEPVIVLREPLLPDVLSGGIPDFSGHGRLWSVPGERAGAGLAEVVVAARARGAASVVVHGGSRFTSGSLTVLAASGADALGLAAASVGTREWEQVAGLVEDGTRIWFGLPPCSPDERPDTIALARLVAGPWTAVGLPAAGLADVVVHAETWTGGGARESGSGVLRDVRAAVAVTVEVAARIAERAADG